VHPLIAHLFFGKGMAGMDIRSKSEVNVRELNATHPDATVACALNRLERALSAGDVDAAVAEFGEQCFWRDLLAFTWNIRTMEGPAQIRDMLKARLVETRSTGWRIQEGESVSEVDGIVESWISFETPVASCYGYARFKDGKIWTLLTAMDELKGFQEPLGSLRPRGVTSGLEMGRKTWKESREEEQRTLGLDRQPYVVIVGGGQGGIALGARLRQLDVPAIILERNDRAGDSWRNRYKTLCLQDPVWYDHLPYIEFPGNWPVYSPKDKLGDWLEMYTRVMELNYWGASAAKSARYDEQKQEWTVVVNRDDKEVNLHPKHVVLATGMSGKPHTPDFPGKERFKGDQHHSAHHPGPDKYVGKKAVVIGSNNSSHDICQALVEAGCDVTMVQRSSTLIAKQSSLMEFGLKKLYSEDALAAGITTAKADATFASVPFALLADFQRPVNQSIRAHDKDFYEKLAKVGFMTDWGEDDDTGVFMKYLTRGAGYYIDVGASGLVIDGIIKLKSRVEIAEIREHSVLLSDGSELPADLIVYATGYKSMESWAAEIIGEDVASKIGRVWGIGAGINRDPPPWEGELRNMWKPTRQEGLWFHGGNLAQSRYYSKILALQLKARMEGVPTPVY
jgi:putative flavoprotein involved in K+ transport